MKKKNILIAFVAAVSLVTVSCTEKKLSPDSVISAPSVEKNAFDLWLDYNFLKPYNIEFRYRYDLNESDMYRMTIPADYDASIMYAHLVQYLCIDTYNEVAGVDFTKAYFPKMFFLIGEWEYDNNGNFILGTAEGGKKIMLSGVNLLPGKFASFSGSGLKKELSEDYIKTIHHEFTHILNQIKGYSESFKEITASTYQADSWSESDSKYRQRGYITKYAQKEDREDFAELLSEYITHDEDWWQKELTKAGDEGKSLILAKFIIVRDYMSSSWGIDVDELRDVVNRRFDDVVDGRVNLTDLSI